MRISGRVVVASAERVQRLPAPFLSEMADLQAAQLRRGRPVVDLGRFALRREPADQTAHSITEPEIRRVLAEYLASEYEVELDPQREMLLMPGTKIALLLLNAYLADADTVYHVPDPGYLSYRVFATLFGAQIKPYPLYQRNDFLPNLEQFRARGARSFGVLLVNSPHNPTGAVCDKEFYRRLHKCAVESNLLTIVDSSYALSFAGNFQPPLLCQTPRNLRTGLELISFSTSLLAPELKLTALIGRKTLIQPLAALARSLSFEVPQAVIRSAAAYLRDAETLRAQIAGCRNEIAQRMTIVTDKLRSAGIEYFPTAGCGFVWVQLRHRRVAVNFARSLLRSKGVLVAPGSAFGENGEGWIRISANVGGEELAAALDQFVRHYQPIRSRLHARQK